MLPARVAVFGGRLASPVLLSPTVEVWLLLQLRLLLGGHHQHRVCLAAVFRVIRVFSLNRYINNKGRVREGKGLTATGFDCGEPAPADEKGTGGLSHTMARQSNKTSQELHFSLLDLKREAVRFSCFLVTGFWS